MTTPARLAASATERIMSKMRPYFLSASVMRKPSDSSRMAFLPGSSSMPRITYWMAPSVPAAKISFSSGSRRSSSSDAPNDEMRPIIVQRTRSAAACRARRSVVNCCRAPMPAAVRRMATRSPGRICSSMKRRRAARTRAMLSKDRFKSSTTIAIVRRTASRLGGAEGRGTPAAAGALLACRRGAAPAGTYWNAEIVCGRLSWSTSKSVASRLVMCRPFSSVTMASSWTSSTEMRSGEGLRSSGSAGAGCCSAPGTVEPMTIRPQMAAAAAGSKGAHQYHRRVAVYCRRPRSDADGAHQKMPGGRSPCGQFFVEVRLIDTDPGGKMISS